MLDFHFIYLRLEWETVKIAYGCIAWNLEEHFFSGRKMTPSFLEDKLNFIQTKNSPENNGKEQG